MYDAENVPNRPADYQTPMALRLTELKQKTIQSGGILILHQHERHLLEQALTIAEATYPGKTVSITNPEEFPCQGYQAVPRSTTHQVNGVNKILETIQYIIGFLGGIAILKIILG